MDNVSQSARDALVGHIRVAIWNACKWQAMGDEKAYALINRAMADPEMLTAFAAHQRGRAQGAAEWAELVTKTCPTCGQTVPEQNAMTDSEIMAALKSRGDMMLYAAGIPGGGADYNSWHLTYGFAKGRRIERGQVDRLLATGQVVPYQEGSRDGFVTPLERRRWDQKLEEHAIRRANRNPERGG